MSKGSKKKVKKNKNINTNKQKLSLNNTEKIEIFIFYFQYLLLILGILGFVLGLIVLYISYYFSLTLYYKTCFVTIVLSSIILFNWYTFGKFIEVRKKYGKKKNKEKK